MAGVYARHMVWTSVYVPVLLDPSASEAERTAWLQGVAEGQAATTEVEWELLPRPEGLVFDTLRVTYPVTT